jgi:hypothetical protein
MWPPLRPLQLSPPSEYGTGCSYTSTPTYVSMAWYLIKHRDKFTFHQYHAIAWRIFCDVSKVGSAERVLVAVTLWVCTQEVLFSNRGWGTRLSWSSSRPIGKRRDSTPIRPQMHLSHLLFTDRPTTRRCVVQIPRAIQNKKMDLFPSSGEWFSLYWDTSGRKQSGVGIEIRTFQITRSRGILITKSQILFMTTCFHRTDKICIWARHGGLIHSKMKSQRRSSM